MAVPEFPYRLEYRPVHGKPEPYVVYIPNGTAGRASKEEEAMLKEIERLRKLLEERSER